MTLHEIEAIEDDWKIEQEIEERRFGRVCALLVNLTRKKGAKASKEEDWILRLKKPKKKSNMQNMKEKLTALFGAPRKKDG